MIIQRTGYGVSLTDEFGYIDGRFEELVTMLNNLEDGDKWLVSCPTDEDPQLVLGFDTYVNKEMNFKKLDEKWHDLMKKLPENILKEVQELNVDPDVCIMAGNC